MRIAFLVFWLSSLAAVACLSLTPKLEFPVDFWSADKLYHTGAYFLVGLLGILSFASRHGKIKAALATVAFGITMELLQGQVPGRTPSVADGVANAAGVIAAWAGHRYLAWNRRGT